MPERQAVAPFAVSIATTAPSRIAYTRPGDSAIHCEDVRVSIGAIQCTAFDALLVSATIMIARSILMPCSAGNERPA
jgi:hypothetical protein